MRFVPDPADDARLQHFSGIRSPDIANTDASETTKTRCPSSANRFVPTSSGHVAFSFVPTSGQRNSSISRASSGTVSFSTLLAGRPLAIDQAFPFPHLSPPGKRKREILST